MCARSRVAYIEDYDRLPRRLLTYNRRRMAVRVRWPLQVRAEAWFGGTVAF